MTGRPSRKIPCGAYARSTGKPCRAKALDNGKCRMHGGLSTGAKTKEGRMKSLMNLRNVGRKIMTNDDYAKRVIEGKSDERATHREFMKQIKYHSWAIKQIQEGKTYDS